MGENFKFLDLEEACFGVFFVTLNLTFSLVTTKSCKNHTFGLKQVQYMLGL